MPQPFIPLSLNEFAKLLEEWHGRRRRDVKEVHMHHTWRPDHSQFDGHESIVAMWRHHTRTNGWNDIAQHVTVAPDGIIWTGRHWDAAPASSTGFNGPAHSPFMFEMVGDFDHGRDRLEGPQLDAALWVISLVQDRFRLSLDSLRFHNQLNSPKTCPGSSIDYADVINKVRQRRGEVPPKARASGARGSNLPAAREWLATEPLPGGNEENEINGRGCGCGTEHMQERSVARRVPFDAQTLSGLRPHVINLWSGRFSEGGIFQTDSGDIDRIFGEELPARIETLTKGETLPLVLYAHGGLVDEKRGLRIAASQVPWWNANGCYPLQFVWETGLLESVARILGAQRARDLADLTDAAVESMVRIGGGPSIWGSMKYAASSAFEPGASGTLVAERIAEVAGKYPDKLRLYLVGHSAGSIFGAHLLRALHAAKAPALEVLFLLAPAITISEHRRLVAPLLPEQVKRILAFTMAKDFELADSVTFAYRKSLLYLIHRALEPRPHEPILGLEECLRGDAALAREFGLAGAAGGLGAVVWAQTKAATGPRTSRSTTHGGFDNDPPTMESILREILGIRADKPIPIPFPPDTESREITAVEPLPETLNSVVAAPPPLRERDTGRLRALCVGVDAYPNPESRLRGCVADARAWADALAGMGFSIEALHDAAATRQAILSQLTALVRGAKAGDVLIFQYSGHGTRVPDYDGDDLSGFDQALCPLDFEDGQLLIDDDIRGVFDQLPQGARLTCFMDNCYSYTNTRFAVGRPTSKVQGSLPRFVELRPEVVERYRSVREATRARSLRGTGAPEDMRWVAFAACNSDELAYETSGRGDFSRIAVPLLAQAATLSNEHFQELVVAGLGAAPRQHPRLDCPHPMRSEKLIFGVGAYPRSFVAPSDNVRPEVAELLGTISRMLR